MGERQTEDLKVPGSIPGLGTFLPPAKIFTFENFMVQQVNHVRIMWLLALAIPNSSRSKSCSSLMLARRLHSAAEVNRFPFSLWSNVVQQNHRFFSGLSYLNGTSGLVAMTSASHAEGRQFDPGLVYFAASSLFFELRIASDAILALELDSGLAPDAIWAPRHPMCFEYWNRMRSSRPMRMQHESHI